MYKKIEWLMIIMLMMFLFFIFLLSIESRNIKLAYIKGRYKGIGTEGMCNIINKTMEGEYCFIYYITHSFCS